MDIKSKLSTNPLHYVYAVVWFGIFAYFAFYIFSGKIFQPDDNGKIHIVAIMVAWIVQYLTQIGTGILVLLIGLFVAYKTILKSTE
jgi:hypothetical protein